ncbi:hypothetical protein E6O75_ATG06216 [Venturia nashicola]|uniref:Uncharacterized protein n=1 Tax=Venturia nashicola TaxID=86259 RepID=A0A4Z1P4H6_9PEZI|nr:hypothetical protein E6O75_ATG06216 [Venturia nashicola]
MNWKLEHTCASCNEQTSAAQHSIAQHSTAQYSTPPPTPEANHLLSLLTWAIVTPTRTRLLLPQTSTLYEPFNAVARRAISNPV